MPQPFKHLFADRTLRGQMLRRGMLWTLVVAFIIGLGSYLSHREDREIALGRARDGFQKDVTTRLWATQRGGVYVPLDQKTPADPYMRDMANREITTTTGPVYTLVNPAHMTRMLHELGRSEFGLQGHITSLKPLRPENAADAWEQKALRRFESGSREYWEELTLEGRPHLRFMGALMISEDCLSCHAAQGYKTGDVRGGISVTVPIGQGSNGYGGYHNLATTLGLGLLWICGLGGILIAGQWKLSQANDRKIADEALREREERFRTLFDHASEGILVLSPEGVAIEFNEAFAAMHGYAKSELSALHLEELDTPESSKSAPDRMRRLLAGEALTYEVEHRHKEGHAFSMEVSASRVPSDGNPNILCFHRDITGRKRAEEKSREAELHYRSLFQSNPHPMWAYDTKTLRFLAVNDAAVLRYGYSEDEFLAMTIKDIRPSEDVAKLDGFIRGIPSTGISESHAWRHLKKDGTCIEVEITSHGYYFGGRSARVVLATDVTERNRVEKEKARLQAQLQQAQKMESLGRLAGGVAHDMNNVLGAILGLASAHVEAQTPGSPEQQAFETIIKASERGGMVVKGLLRFSRQSPVEERELDMNAILGDEIRLLERTTLSKVRLEMDLGSDLRPIRGDESALTHAFMNLCVNAVDAMLENGTLTLRTRNVDADWIEVVVEDTGTGMPMEVLEKAMDPFFTTKEAGKGTGLGLSMVYSTVRAHGGQIEIQSKPGKGTRVRMRFPACQSAARTPEPSGDPRTGASRPSLNVLLVDDDELIRSSMQAILEVLGHKVQTVVSGEEALAALEAGLDPDVVILDMTMPGLGGAGTLPLLRSRRPNLPVLFATGRADQTVLDLVETHSRVTLLPKPFNLKQLQKHLESLEGEGYFHRCSG